MITPSQRLQRMRKSFEDNKSMLADDYAHFIAPTAPATPRASTPPSKAARKSAGRSEQQSREPSETRSSGKTGD